MAGICVIFNPTANGDKARRFRAAIEKLAPEATFKPTTGPGAARQLAALAVEEGFTTIAAAGGDGTLNEVINGIADAPSGLARARFAVLPLGTVNVFALELGIPFATDKAWQILRAGRERACDLLEAEYETNGRRERRVFLQLAGAGWDASAVQGVSWALKKRIGKWAYIVSGLRALRRARAPIKVTSPTESAAGDYIMIGNGRFYGGPFPFMHRANLSDGLMDITIFESFDWRSLPACAAKFVFGKYFREGSQRYIQAQEVELTCEAPTPLQLDGELVGQLPARLRVLPRAMRLVVP